MEKRQITRREFMAAGAIGVASLGLGVRPGSAATANASGGASGIVYRILGRTGLKIPVVSFGVMNSDNPDLIRKALDLGIRHLDTAHRYLRGNSESVIGQVLEERKVRDQVCIATKMYFDRDRERKVFLGPESERPFAASEKKFDEQLAISLKRLRTDYVDILYLHSCESAAMAAYEPMMKVFEKAKESGKVRFIGVTTHTQEPETIRSAADAGVWDVALTSYNFMQDHKEEVKQAIAYAAGKGMGIVAMKTQGGVKLNREDPMQVNHAAALKWVLHDKNVCTTIPGITAFDQMALDFGVMKDLSLSERERRDLHLFAGWKEPLYCQQCGSCLSTCSRRVEIPTLMRVYMYTAAYRNLIQAEMTLEEIPQGRGPEGCGDCERCTALCRFGINIPERIGALRAMNLRTNSPA